MDAGENEFFPSQLTSNSIIDALFVPPKYNNRQMLVTFRFEIVNLLKSLMNE